MRRWRTLDGVVPFLVALVTVTTASAQTLPKGKLEGKPASAGKTDVAEEGFQTAAERDAKANDASEVSVSAGGLVASGNSKQLAFTGSSTVRLRRADHQFSAAAAVNFARAATKEAPGLNTTVSNQQGKIRYDYFLSEKWSLFLQTSARRDRFQGLDLRLNVDPGVAHYFVQDQGLRLWVELGYDYQYDIRTDEAIETARAAGKPVSRTDSRHSARAFAGYESKVNKAVTFATGLEYLQSVEHTNGYRLNWESAVTSSIGGNFSTATTLSVRYDNDPLPGIQKTDVLTSFNLVYTLL